MQDRSRVGRRLLRGVLFGALPLAFVACLPDDSDDDDRRFQGPPPECQVDADCAHLDTDADPCTVVECESQKCAPRVLTSSTECQCATDDDCVRVLGLGAGKECATATCEAHKCSQKIAPAGPAPRQAAGDCAKVTCDGTSATGTKEIDVTDLPDDKDPCTVDTCSPAGAPAHSNNFDGTECGDGSICFSGSCIACKAQNPTSCGSEGPSEPANNTGTSAASYPEHQSVCGFSSGDDIDWYTFFAKDKDFSTEILRFHFWSTAATLEACIYVKCENNGTPEGGCADLKDGPNGSRGCCYSGAPGSVTPEWDLDCAGTSEDSGTVYVSVRTPGGNACERYTMSGGY